MTKVVHDGWGTELGGDKRPRIGGDGVRQENRNKVTLCLEDK